MFVYEKFGTKAVAICGVELSELDIDCAAVCPVCPSVRTGGNANSRPPRSLALNAVSCFAIAKARLRPALRLNGRTVAEVAFG